MVKVTKLADSLDWPSEGEELVKVEIQCFGGGFLEYLKVRSAGDNFEGLVNSTGDNNSTSGTNEADDATLLEEDSSPAIDLFALTEKQLADLNFYQVLHLPYKANLTPDDVKKAYRKASLKYHPDKSGRGEEDAVFLKVKAAFETLSTQKQAYDSTEMPFDDSLPDEDPDDFFAEYAPVFERNLHFDSRLLQSSNGNSNNQNGKKNKNNRRKSRSSQNTKTMSKPPALGDNNTPIDQVHEFYDYWTHFSSWRDFSMQASRETETQEHLENAESRYEKRWYQKEIDRRAKKLKQQEQARITTLVERAMAVDPRLIQERKRLIEEKEMKQRQREQDALDKKRQKEEAKLAEAKRIEEEKERKAQEKMQREKEKKMLRKTKQVFRRVVAEALQALLEPEYALDDQTEVILGKLNRDQLLKLNDKLEAIKSDPPQVVNAVKTKAHNIENGIADEDDDNEPPPLKPETNADEQRKKEIAAPAPAPSASSTSNKTPFTKDELSALAKGIKKYPPGGANRWDKIASYINSVCRPEILRTREECIEIFNQNKTNKSQDANSAPSTANDPAPKASGAATSTETWTEEQDEKLQEALAKFPSSMDKNERWTSIAGIVPGKTKKQCVARFKVIRDAIKNKK